LIKLRAKNSDFQSCRFCDVGGSLYRVDSEEGTYYLCDRHRQTKESIKDQPIEGTEEESFVPTVGIVKRAINYIKGGRNG